MYWGGVDASKKMVSFEFAFFVLAILLFMRAARLRNGYYFGISSKGTSPCADADFHETSRLEVL